MARPTGHVPGHVRSRVTCGQVRPTPDGNSAWLSAMAGHVRSSPFSGTGRAVPAETHARPAASGPPHAAPCYSVAQQVHGKVWKETLTLGMLQKSKSDEHSTLCFFLFLCSLCILRSDNYLNTSMHYYGLRKKIVLFLRLQNESERKSKGS